MTPAARVQAAIELLDAILDAAKGQGAPADRLIADFFRARRYAGSKDRRAVRELVYAAIRACGPVPARRQASTTTCHFRTQTFHYPQPMGGEANAARGLGSTAKHRNCSFEAGQSGHPVQPMAHAPGGRKRQSLGSTVSRIHGYSEEIPPNSKTTNRTKS